ncbi:6-phosphofructokinase [Solemya velum gill symbiont]|uniref:6-phosphofructokinase n=1 Tax=Solemya velum gill symbiont TaxID=2340 RepID=UPI0009965F2D|nr:6-phosphofructokinase [Solemya velum gill symbiont]OOZ29232.1 6-phosphofructokinase [Solemya velum gill symbiont]
MSAKNAFYAQSGGVTSVINASACGVIETARQHPDKIANVYAGRNGIIGALTEELIDTSQESDEAIAALKHTPSGAFGSCRFKLKSLEDNKREYERLIEIFKAHNIGYFFYNGGGDSADTCFKVSQLSEKMGFPVQAIHIPKTVDNDLPITDNCPGFGSVAKYIAVSTLEASYDVRSMAKTSTKIFVIGYCTIVVSEGAHWPDGTFLAEQGTRDSFGHAQLGGAAPVVANMIKDALGYKFHWAVADYLQRAARHLASGSDVEQAYALGKAGVEKALEGKNSIMPTVVRESSSPYKWSIGEAPLSEVANVEKMMPMEYISEDGFGITDGCKEYLYPLIKGESYPPYDDNGMPDYVTLKLAGVERKLEDFEL